MKPTRHKYSNYKPNDLNYIEIRLSSAVLTIKLRSTEPIVLTYIDSDSNIVEMNVSNEISTFSLQQDSGTILCIKGDVSKITYISISGQLHRMNTSQLRKMPLLEQIAGTAMVGDLVSSDSLKNAYDISLTAPGGGIDESVLYGDLSKISKVEKILVVTDNLATEVTGFLSVGNKPETFNVALLRSSLSWNSEYYFNPILKRIYLSTSDGNFTPEILDQILFRIVESITLEFRKGGVIGLKTGTVKRTSASNDAVALLVSLGYNVVN